MWDDGLMRKSLTVLIVSLGVVLLGFGGVAGAHCMPKPTPPPTTVPYVPMAPVTPTTVPVVTVPTTPVTVPAPVVPAPVSGPPVAVPPAAVSTAVPSIAPGQIQPTATQAPVGPQLAFTGVNYKLLALIGIVLVLCGIALMRRRHTS
jgi:hypothetical protein